MAHPRITRTTTILLSLALALALLAAAAPAAEAAPAHPSAETRMLSRINSAREAQGLRRLSSNLQMKRIARQWARRMASEQRVYHRPNLADVVDGDYVRLGENVGVTQLTGASAATLVDRLHNAFMGSPGHRSHILGRYNMAGVGIFIDAADRMWVAVNFLKGSPSGFPLYRDIAGLSAEGEIGHLFVRGAVSGCTSRRFCPKVTATRRYLSAVIDRATRTRTASSYVASTCETSACVTGEITRVELAKILAQALRLDATSGTRFTDVRSKDRGAVYAVVRAGIMGGCAETRFCPGGTMSRARAIKVVHRAITL